MKTIWIGLLSLGALMAATAMPAAARVDAQVSISLGPRTVHAAPRPAARHGHLWQPGYWDVHRGRHVWVPGSWVPARQGYRYNQPQWVSHQGRWIPARGHGVRAHPGRDRDGDGLRDRVDRDRDGDGVPNRRDARPNNPYRR